MLKLWNNVWAVWIRCCYNMLIMHWGIILQEISGKALIEDHIKGYLHRTID